VIGGSIWPMPILNRHLTHTRFIGAHNLWYLRAWLTPSSARMCLQLAKGGCVFCTSENEAECPIEMIIHFSEFNNVGNASVWFAE
jgi:hypothetical protein